MPDVAGIDKRFDYLAPPDTPIGAMVRVVLNRRHIGAWVVETDVSPPAGVRLVPVKKVSSLGPSQDVIDVAEWAAWRWAGPVRWMLLSASPPANVRALPAPPAPGPPVVVPHSLPAGERVVVRTPPSDDGFWAVAAAAARGDALVLAPSVAGAQLLGARLRRMGVPVAVMPRDWARAAAGGCVVVGARAAAWAPVPELSAVVVLDAHDEVYQAEAAPTWNAWLVAAERAKRAGVPCVLLSPCPTLEQLAWGSLVTAPRAEERVRWPIVDVIDRRQEDPRSGLFSERLVSVVRDPSKRVACVLNRKGRARLLACTACGEVARCEQCEGSVASVVEGVLACARCRTERPYVCQSCGSQRLKLLRLGVSRVREELEALAGEPVGDVTGESDELPSARVLVGTEAVLHRLGSAGVDVDVVAFLDFDQELFAPRYRAAEQALAMLARAGRLVGPRGSGASSGRVLVQTRAPEHEVLDAAVHGDPSRLVAVERERREALGMPPFGALALVSGDGADEFVRALPADYAVDALGPTEGRWLLRAADHVTLCNALANTPRPTARLRVEVDPIRA